MSAKEKKPEAEIRALFTQYNDQLTKRKKDISDQLTRWSKELIRHIQEHTNTQSKLLDEHFEKRKVFFETERKRAISTINEHEKRKETQEIERLLTEFRSLILNLPILHPYETMTSYMHVLPEEELPGKERERTGTRKPNESPANNPADKENNNDTKNIAISTRISSARPPSARNKQLNGSSIETQTSIPCDSSTTGHASSNTDMKKSDGLLEKCVICFMIFPKNMSKEDREIHIDEHYTD